MGVLMIDFFCLKSKIPISLKFLKIFFSIFLFIFICYSIKWNNFIDGLNKLSFSYICAAFIFCFINVFILGTRWYFMVKVEFTQSFQRHLKNFFRASFFNLITPAAIGSDLYRLIETKRSNGNSSIIAGFLIRERIIGLLGFSFFYVSCLVWYLIERGFLMTAPIFKDVGLLLLVLIIAIIIVHSYSKFLINIVSKHFFKKWVISLNHLSTSLNYRSTLEFVCLTLWTLLSCLSWAIGAYFLTLSFDLPVSFSGIGLICVISEFSRWLPLTPQGVGVRESVFAYGFSLIGFPAELV